MDRRQMCVSNVQYHKPLAAGGAKNLLRYLTYRDGRYGNIQQITGKDRWVDRGMGQSVAAIARQCQAMSSDHVLLFSLVINPNPDLIAMIPVQEREAFVKDLTEKVVESFFETRGIDTGIEFSYVLHHRETDDPQAPGQHNPHTHVVLPGTVFSESDDQRVPLYFSQNKKVDHIEMLHRVTETEMAQMLDHTIGRDWEQRYDALQAEREHEFTITDGAPHAFEKDDEGISQPVWVGTRRTDGKTTAIGTYRLHSAPTRDDPDAQDIRFRPLIGGLSQQEAAVLARAFAHSIQGDMDLLHGYIAAISTMEVEERTALVAEVQQEEHIRQTQMHMREPSFGIDR